MPYVSPAQIQQARQMDLLSFLQRYQPDELVKMGNYAYVTRSHDSLCISNGKWFWWSQGIGGRSALDYLVAVQQMPFTEAVEILTGSTAAFPSTPPPLKTPVPFVLPTKNENNRRVSAYLAWRGIDYEIINHCIKHGRLYESKESYVHPKTKEKTEIHNAVFVGRDGQGEARYAFLRAINSGSSFMREVDGSDKRFGFSLLTEREHDTLHIYESAIDLLSFATLAKMQGQDWRSFAYLSLGGVAPPRDYGVPSLPLALDRYLQTHPAPATLVLCLDADAAGQRAAAMIQATLPQLAVIYAPTGRGKDYNELLQIEKEIQSPVAMRGHKPADKEDIR